MLSRQNADLVMAGYDAWQTETRMLNREIDGGDALLRHPLDERQRLLVGPQRDEDAVVVRGRRQAAEPVVDGQHPAVVLGETRYAADPEIADRRDHNEHLFPLHGGKGIISTFRRQDELFCFLEYKLHDFPFRPNRKNGGTCFP